MGREPGLAEPSYLARERGYDDCRSGSGRASLAAAWLDGGSVNSWRFERMYRVALPLLEAYPGAQWLTVGDGRYGLDAMYLRRHGAHALATDISDTLLAEAKQRGLIPDYRKENAEALSFADAVRLGVRALMVTQNKTLTERDLEVAVLDREKERRKFRRIPPEVLHQLLSDGR